MIRIREEVRGVKAGSEIEKWTVLGSAFSRGRDTWSFVCRCECGGISVVRLSTLLNGESTGCMRCHWRSVNGTHGEGNKTIRLYRIWSHMLGRCYCETDHKYHRYGGRGIAVCEAWRDYEAFRDWAMANGYSDDLTIDRFPNNDGNYEPGNCRWATATEQARNTSSSRLLTANGETLPIAEWADKVGVKSATIRKRIKLGWTPEQALDPYVSRNKYDGRRAKSADSGRARDLGKGLD